jgi:hypothetical protein
MVSTQYRNTHTRIITRYTVHALRITLYGYVQGKRVVQVPEINTGYVNGT